MLEEVEQTVVGPLKVLDHKCHRALDRQPLEEGPPRGEQLLVPAGHGLPRPEEGVQARLDPGALRDIRHVPGDHRGDRGAGCLGVVALGQTSPPPDHFAERPEGDALSV